MATRKPPSKSPKKAASKVKARSTRGKSKRSPAKTGVKSKTKNSKNERDLTGFRPVKAEIVESDTSAADMANETADAILENGFNEEIEVDPESLPEPTDFDGRALAIADPVTRYMQEIGRYPLLSREDEYKLAVKYKETGDPRAAEALVTSNLRFVVKVASEYSRFGAKLIDLVQEGNVGLMHAVKEFNPYKGVRLITYAVWWIRGYIQEYLMRQYSMVRIGTTANQRKLFYQLQKERERLEREGFDTGVARLSGRLGIPEEEVESMAKRMSGRDVSLDQPLTEDGTTRLVDLQSESDTDELEATVGMREQLNLLMREIDKLRPTLNEKELYLLDERLLSDEPLTLQEIGEKYGTTREAVRQMEARLLQKIKRGVIPPT